MTNITKERKRFADLANAYFEIQKKVLNYELDDIAKRKGLTFGKSVLVNDLAEYYLLADKDEQLRLNRFNTSRDNIRLFGYKISKNYRVNRSICLPISGALFSPKLNVNGDDLDDYSFDHCFSQCRVVDDLLTCKINKLMG